MSLDPIGFGARRVLRRDDDKIEQVLTERPLHRVLAFTGHTIDDVVNSPIVKNKVRGFYRAYRQIQRRGEIVELERQWNQA